jgi:predicted ArsR family transcriptional regulator
MQRLLGSARGKILVALRRRGAASASDLARELHLSTNAVRQQCILLERDNLVVGYSVRRSKTKPTMEYKLTPAAEKYFPQRYDRMLNAVLREVRAAGGSSAVRAIFSSMSRRKATLLKARFGDRPVAERVAEVAEALRRSGVEVRTEQTSFGFRIRELNCPLSATVAEHPEVCSMMCSIVEEAVAPEVRQTNCIASGDSECTFEIRTEPQE